MWPATREAGFDVGVSYVFKDHHVTYYPGSSPLALKLVYDRRTRRLLGGQAYGRNGAEKRIAVLATALHGKLTLEDLSELDLAYAPLAGVLHIPAGEVRERIAEIPNGKPVYILSKDGFLGHTTLQVQKGNGWRKVYNVAGGYLAARWVEG